MKIGFLFDLDGVLIDSERSYTRIWEEIDREFPTGVPGFARRIKGTTLNDILARYYPDPKVQRKVTASLARQERKMRFSYMPSARALLAELKARKIPTALVTSSDHNKMALLHQQMPELTSWFDVVVDGSMVTRSKPDPEPYLRASEMIGVPSGRCAVFEDALAGLAAGRAAGAYTLGMTDTLGREALDGQAEELHDSLEEIDVDALLQRIQNVNCSAR